MYEWYKTNGFWERRNYVYIANSCREVYNYGNKLLIKSSTCNSTGCVKIKTSNLSAYLAGVIVEKATNMNIINYLQPRLFAPLEIENVECAYSPEGHFYGATGMELTINELSRFGQLYLQEGYYKGQQLLSKEWVNKAATKQIETWEGGYGYYFWKERGQSYRASGMKGQRCIVVPEKNAVVAVMSDLGDGSDERKHSEEMMQYIWNTVIMKL